VQQPDVFLANVGGTESLRAKFTTISAAAVHLLANEQDR
jgi:hypothetical protein